MRVERFFIGCSSIQVALKKGNQCTKQCMHTFSLAMSGAFTCAFDLNQLMIQEQRGKELSLSFSFQEVSKIGEDTVVHFHLSLLLSLLSS